MRGGPILRWLCCLALLAGCHDSSGAGGSGTAGGGNMDSLDCEGSCSCDPETDTCVCQGGSSCDATCDGPCTLRCEGNARCEIACPEECNVECPGTAGSAATAGDRSGGSCGGTGDCEFTCEGDCSFSCPGAARCLVRCAAGASCAIEDCRAPEDCGKGVQVCGRPCPE